MRTARKLLMMCALLCGAVAWLGNEECTSPIAAPEGAPDPSLPPETQAALRSAMANLATHDLRGARRDFNFALSLSPQSGQARLGAALTRLLLLPEDPSALALTRALGGEPVLWQEAAFGEGGALDTLANDDDPERRDAALDRLLPWPRATLEDPAQIADALPPEQPLNALVPHLEGLTDAIEGTADDLHGGLLTPDFAPFVFPLTTFHGGTRITLDAPEILVLEGGLRLGAAALRWACAYDWPQQMGALGSASTTAQRLEHFNAAALRAVAQPRALEQAQGQLTQGLASLRLALELAPLSGDGHLRLHNLSPATSAALQRLLAALERAPSLPTPLPDTTPPATLALAPLFSGRVLPAQLGLLRLEDDRRDEDRRDEDQSEISFDYEGLREFFLRDVLSPDCDLDPDAPGACPTFRHEGRDLLEISAQIADPARSALEEDYQ